MQARRGALTVCVKSSDESCTSTPTTYEVLVELTPPAPGRHAVASTSNHCAKFLRRFAKVTTIVLIVHLLPPGCTDEQLPVVSNPLS